MKLVSLLITLVAAATDFPVFEIDLDQHPNLRFKQVAIHFRPQILATFNTIISQVPEAVVSGFEYTAWLWDISQHEKYQEIKGIVQALDDPQITLPKTILINSLYELEAWCTSIIARQQDGTIIHSRNLDFDNASLMREITFQAKFVRGGMYVFDAIMFAGTTGVYTGMKAGAFSVSENERRFNEEEKGLAENILMLFSGYNEISWLIRETLTTCDDFQCAYQKLSTGDISALGYIILAGTKGDEGVVITGNRFGEAHEERLNATEGKWFLVQTNNDHWDSGCYNRCLSATERMQQISQELVSHSTMRESVMLQFPN